MEGRNGGRVEMNKGRKTGGREGYKAPWIPRLPTVASIGSGGLIKKQGVMWTAAWTATVDDETG